MRGPFPEQPGLSLRDLPTLVGRQAFQMATRRTRPGRLDPLVRRLALKTTTLMDRRSSSARGNLEAIYGQTSAHHGGPLLLGHRGAMARAPENTLGAFQAAMDDGAHGVELDTTLSGDSIPVVIHDDTLDRTTEVLGKPSDYDVEELAGIDAGSWYPGWGFEPVPRLRQVFEQMPDGSVVNVELKGPTPGWAALERQVVQEIQHLAGRLHIIVSSFHPAQLLEVRRLDDRIPIALLISARSILPLRTGWALPALGAEALHAPCSIVDAGLVAAARDAQVRLNVWGIRGPEDVERMLDLGVDGLIVDDVAAAREAIVRRR